MHTPSRSCTSSRSPGAARSSSRASGWNGWGASGIGQGTGERGTGGTAEEKVFRLRHRGGGQGLAAAAGNLPCISPPWAGETSERRSSVLPNPKRNDCMGSALLLSIDQGTTSSRRPSTTAPATRWPAAAPPWRASTPPMAGWSSTPRRSGRASSRRCRSWSARSARSSAAPWPPAASPTSAKPPCCGGAAAASPGAGDRVAGRAHRRPLRRVEAPGAGGPPAAAHRPAGGSLLQRQQDRVGAAGASPRGGGRRRRGALLRHGGQLAAVAPLRAAMPPTAATPAAPC